MFLTHATYIFIQYFNEAANKLSNQATLTFIRKISSQMLDTRY